MSSTPPSARPLLTKISPAPFWARGEPSRLPTPLSSLIGREREIAAVGALLRDPAVRLVTLTGPGGVGKTRLALHLAAEMMADERFADGVALVDLTSVRDPDHVTPAIAQTLGVRAIGQEPAESALRSFLRAKNLLLVLDNFEQVRQAGPRVTDLLQACPGLTVVVTSRALLNVSGERAALVPPLSLGVGDGESERPVSSSRRPISPFHSHTVPSEAVRLFVERTREVNPAFVLSDTNADEVAEIVRRLDGLPLAIELAAARGTLFSPAALLARLEHRLPQLTGGPQDQPERHQTMRAAIAWSYDLLATEEQRIFRALSAFVGGFTLEAAEAICHETEGQRDAGTMGTASNAEPPSSRPPVPDVVAAIESLTRQSLLRVIDHSAAGADVDTPRITMLETVREFAVEQLTARSERGPRQRHAEYFGALATRAEPTYWGDAPGDWRAVIGFEEGNLQAALDWATEHGEADLALRLASARFDPHVDSNFHWTTGAGARAHRQWTRRALALPGGSPANRVRALTTAAWLAHVHDDFAEGRTLAVEALNLARVRDDAFGVAGASFVLGVAAFREGNVAASRQHLNDALSGFRALNAPGRSAWTLVHLASLDSRDAIDEGGDATDLDRAAGLNEEALTLFRDVHHTHGIVRALHGRAYIAYKQRDLPQALSLTQEVLTLDWERRWPIYYYLEDIADLAGRIDQPNLAARLYGAADGLRNRAGRPVEPVFQSEFERDVAVSRRALGEAAFAQAWAAGRVQPIDDIVAEALALRTAIAARPGASLTPRETEILRLLATGQTNPAIAAALFISVRTVENHVAHILAKLGVTTRAAVVDAAIAAGLVPPESEPPA